MSDATDVNERRVQLNRRSEFLRIMAAGSKSTRRDALLRARAQRVIDDAIAEKRRIERGFADRLMDMADGLRMPVHGAVWWDIGRDMVAHFRWWVDGERVPVDVLGKFGAMRATATPGMRGLPKFNRDVGGVDDA